MATYKSNPVDLGQNVETVYNKLTDLNKLAGFIKNIPAESIPADKRELLDQITVTDESITIPGGPTGPVTLVKGDCNPVSKVTYIGQGTPVPVTLECDLVPTGADSCQAVVTADIKVPMMLKPMLNGPMNQLMAQVSQALTQIARPSFDA